MELLTKLKIRQPAGGSARSEAEVCVWWGAGGMQ